LFHNEGGYVSMRGRRPTRGRKKLFQKGEEKKLLPEERERCFGAIPALDKNLVQ